MTWQVCALMKPSLQKKYPVVLSGQQICESSQLAKFASKQNPFGIFHPTHCLGMGTLGCELIGQRMDGSPTAYEIGSLHQKQVLLPRVPHPPLGFAFVESSESVAKQVAAK